MFTMSNVSPRSLSSFRHWASLLSSPEYRLRLLLLLPPWFTVGMSSYGVHFSISLLQYDIFVVSVMKDLVTMAAIFILMPVFNRVRKKDPPQKSKLFMPPLEPIVYPFCFQCHRSPLLLASFVVDALLALSFFVMPADATTARVVIFVITQV